MKLQKTQQALEILRLANFIDAFDQNISNNLRIRKRDVKGKSTDTLLLRISKVRLESRSSMQVFASADLPSLSQHLTLVDLFKNAPWRSVVRNESTTAPVLLYKAMQQNA